MIYKRSSELFVEAQKVIPGGVNSPVRAFKSVGGHPIFVKEAKGAYLYDEDGRELIDYIASWGPMILGHAHKPVVDAVVAKAQKGTSFGMPTEIETQIAELAISMVPGIDKIRFVNSGTEACMSAVRLARGFTGREKIIKFAGCYHGKHFPERMNMQEYRKIKSLKSFDDIYTAPAHGFEDALDYYAKASSYDYLNTIKVPTLILNAKNDSFLHGKCYPVTQAKNSKYLHLEMPEHGGHVGFYLKGSYYYNELRTLDFFEKSIE